MKHGDRLIKYSIECHDDGDGDISSLSRHSSVTILAVTDPLHDHEFETLGMQLRGRGYSPPFINTSDERMLIDDFWAAVGVVERMRKREDATERMWLLRLVA